MLVVQYDPVISFMDSPRQSYPVFDPLPIDPHALMCSKYFYQYFRVT